MLVEFKNKKPNIEKLLAFGFVGQNELYAYSADLADCQMKMTVTVSKDGRIDTKVLDNSSGDEYVLHLVDSAVGAYVGRVKAEYEEILEEISEKCFDMEVFKSKQAKAVIAYVNQAYGDEPEYLWKKFPDNAIVRRKDNQKWYIALLTVSRRKLGLDCDESVEILDIRMRPEEIQAMVDNQKYFPGYHMNKNHWITICLDGSIAFEEICSRISDSYQLALK
ncbi:MAG: MmcQ/YjbR family DNA-binding protein [Clostridia bacterium]|nr:MmcQ/YjbR family DNA-binding protein [Clostridia bacterium]